MKALFIGSDPTLFDTGSHTYARIRSYAEVIGSVHVLMRSSTPDSLQADGPLTVQGVCAGKLEAAKKLSTIARSIILNEGIEIVSAQDPFEHGWIAMRAVKGTNAKLHVQVHTDFLSSWFVRGGVLRSPQITMPLKNRIRQKLADRVLPKADGIRVVSRRIKDSLEKRYGSKIVTPTVIPIAVSTTVPPPAPLPRHSFPFALVTVGRLEPEKRIDDILEALVLLQGRYPAVGLVVIGDGREKERLMARVVEKGLMGQVVFAGECPDAWGMMRSAQGYIQASAYEGYGRTLMEAALSRLPIITTDVGVVGEVFTGYEDVLSTPPGDPAQLAVNIVALLEDVGTRETMVRSAEAKALAHLAEYQDLPALIASDLSRTCTSSKGV